MDFNKAAPWWTSKINRAIADVRKTASWVQFRQCVLLEASAVVWCRRRQWMETESIGGIICANENKRSRSGVHYLIGFLTALPARSNFHLHLTPRQSLCWCRLQTILEICCTSWQLLILYADHQDRMFCLQSEQKFMVFFSRMPRKKCALQYYSIIQ